MQHTYEYPRPAVAVDLLIFQASQADQQLLLIRRKNEPFQNSWALPGGFLDEGETLEAAAARELNEETGLTVTPENLQQLKAYSTVDRDPRTRVISVVFISLVNVEDDHQVTAGDDAAQADWFSISNLPELAFDHADIIRDGLNFLSQSSASRH